MCDRVCVASAVLRQTEVEADGEEEGMQEDEEEEEEKGRDLFVSES